MLVLGTGIYYLYGANGALKFAISASMFYYCFMFSDFPAISDTLHCNSVFTNQVSGSSDPCDLDAKRAQFKSLLRHLTILIQISLPDPLSANYGYTSLCSCCRLWEYRCEVCLEGPKYKNNEVRNCIAWTSSSCLSKAVSRGLLSPHSEEGPRYHTKSVI